MTQHHVLALNEIRQSYSGAVVLNEVSFAIPAGVVVGLVGPNGAGKTTLMRIAAGLQVPDAGRVSSRRAGYFGGFDTLPVSGTINGLRRGLGLQPHAAGSKRLSKLSRGELQSVGLVAAFELGCDVLLLDEPWTSLEPDRRDALSTRISDYARTGRSVVCSSHELDEVARVAQEVLFIGGGQLIRVQAENGGFDRENLLRLYRSVIAQEKRPDATLYV